MNISAKKSLIATILPSLLTIAALGSARPANADQPTDPPATIDVSDGSVDFAPPTEFALLDGLESLTARAAQAAPTRSSESLDAHYRELARRLTAQHDDLELQAPAKDLQAPAAKKPTQAAARPAATTTTQTTRTYRTTQPRTYSRGNVRYTYPAWNGNAANWQRYIPAPVARRIFRR